MIQISKVHLDDFDKIQIHLLKRFYSLDKSLRFSRKSEANENFIVTDVVLTLDEYKHEFIVVSYTYDHNNGDCIIDASMAYLGKVPSIPLKATKNKIANLILDYASEFNNSLRTAYLEDLYIAI